MCCMRWLGASNLDGLGPPTLDLGHLSIKFQCLTGLDFQQKMQKWSTLKLPPLHVLSTHLLQVKVS